MGPCGWSNTAFGCRFVRSKPRRCRDGCARAPNARHLDLEPEAAQLIVDRVEGNLLAANQELDKLVLLANGKRITAELVLRSVGDSARYDVFQLGQRRRRGFATCAANLARPEERRREPTLILWALDSRASWAVAGAGAQPIALPRSGSGWNLAATPSSAALARISKIPLADCCVRRITPTASSRVWRAAMMDRGHRPRRGYGGALQATEDSGRVQS